MAYPQDPLRSSASSRGNWSLPEETESYGTSVSGAHGEYSRGLIDLTQILGFIRRNFFRVAIGTVLLTAVFFSLFSLFSFPYKATALVLIDPREQRITLTENVLPGIGTDAAFLESVVQIVQSNGFLRPVLEETNAQADPLFAQAVSSSGGDDRPLLEAFKNQLSVFRVGATFIVEISFLADDPQKAAFYANAVAQAFVDSQTQSFVTANVSAAATLSERLETLKQSLKTSEDKVAQFKAENGIVDVAQDSTLLQRQLISVNDQIAAAKTAAETAKADYQQFQSATGSVESSGPNSPFQQLADLRRLRAQSLQTLSEFSTIYGERHPRVIAERSKLNGLDRQIAEERRRVQESLKERRDSAVATQQALEVELADLQKRAVQTDAALVQLTNLELEASANRRLYEEFLERFKATDEQSGLEIEQAQIASAATAPLKTTRPSTSLAAMVFLLLSGLIATAYAIVRELYIAQKAMIPRVQATSIVPKQTDQTNVDGSRAYRRFAPTKPHVGANLPRKWDEDAQQKVSKRRQFNDLSLMRREIDNQEGTTHDVLEVARELLGSALKDELGTVLRPGAITIVGSSRPCPEKTTITYSLAAIAGLQSLSTVVLNADEDIRTADNAEHQLSKVMRDCPVSIIRPEDLATSGKANDLEAVLDILRGFSASKSGREGCLIVDAFLPEDPKSLELLAQYCDCIIRVESGEYWDDQRRRGKLGKLRSENRCRFKNIVVS